MAQTPDRREVRRRWLNLLIAGVLLAACDFNPVLGDGRSPERQRRPVETVTALEIDAADLRVDHPTPARPDSR